RAIIDATLVAFPIRDGRTGPCRRSALNVQDRNLTAVAALIRSQHEVQSLLRSHTRLEQLDADIAIHRIRSGLMRKNRDATLAAADAASNSNGLGMNGDSQFARIRISADDGKRPFFAGRVDLCLCVDSKSKHDQYHHVDSHHDLLLVTVPRTEPLT